MKNYPLIQLFKKHFFNKSLLQSSSTLTIEYALHKDNMFTVLLNLLMHQITKTTKKSPK